MDMDFYGDDHEYLDVTETEEVEISRTNEATASELPDVAETTTVSAVHSTITDIKKFESPNNGMRVISTTAENEMAYSPSATSASGRIFLNLETFENTKTNWSESRNESDSQNVTLHEEFSEDLYHQWIVFEVLSYVMLMINIYVLASTSVYHILQGGLVPKNSKAPPRAKKYVISLNILMILSITFTIIRIILNLDTIWGRSNDLSCVYLKNPKIVAGLLAYGSFYCLFWARQRIFYNNPHLKHLSNRFLEVLSIATFSVLMILYLSILILFIVIDDTYQALVPNGCSVSTNMLPWYILGATCVLMQALLLILFIYPLIQNKKNSDILKSTSQPVFDLIRKVSFIAIAAVVSCVISILLINFLKTEVDETSLFLADLNLTLLLFFASAQFVDCKKRLFPWRQLVVNDKEERRNCKILTTTT